MRFLRHLILFSFSMIACLLHAGAIAPAEQDQGIGSQQQAGPPGTIRVRVRLIPVDVIVTDRQDKPVRDLKAEDFQVFEEGRPQEIRHFSIQTYSTDSPRPAPPIVTGGNPALEVAPQPSRTFLILLGRGRHQIPHKAVDTLIRFVRNGLLPRDRVAVFAYNRATDFTTDHERIAQVLELYKKSNEKIESWLETRFRGLTSVYGLKEIPKSYQSEIDKIFRSDGLLASRQVPPGRMTEKGTIVKDWQRSADALVKDADVAAEADIRTEVAEEVAETELPGSQVMLSLIKFDTMLGEAITLSLSFDQFAPKAAGSFQDLQNLYTCIEYMRYMDGEKHLLFFTGEGLLFPGGNDTYDKGVVAMANDARVSIESFHTGGLFHDPEYVPTRGITLQAQPRNSQTTVMPPPPAISQASWSSTFMLSAISNVSTWTGGRATISGDISKALDRLDEITRVQYLLGYYPTDNRWDGKYRQIHVKVNRPGMKISFRRGYYARDSLRPYDREEFLAYSRISAAGAYESDVGDVPFKVATIKSRDEAGEPKIGVDMRIEAEKVGFKMAGDRHLGRLYIAVFYADGSEKYLGESWKTLNLELPEDKYQELLRSGILFSTQIPQKASTQILKVIVYDTWSDRVGSKLIKVR